jgi:hypothetical protein
MKYCKWSVICCLLLLIIAINQTGNATTDYVFVGVGGDTTVNTATQGDELFWGSNCEVGASVQWEIYYDIDSNNIIDDPGDKLLFDFIITDGDMVGDGGPTDTDPIPDGIILVPPMVLGFAPGYYIIRATDQTDASSAEKWFAMDPLLTPPNSFSGQVTIPGHPAPDALLQNIWIQAEEIEGGFQIWAATTNDNGDYEINIGDAGTDVLFRITPEDITGYVSPGSQEQTASGAIGAIDFAYMSPADSIYGVIMDENDNLIETASVYAQPNFSGPGQKNCDVTDGHYVIYFGEDEGGEWNLGIESNGLIPNYMIPQNHSIDNSVEHEIEYNFVVNTTDTVIYVRVTESGGEPANPYRLQALSNLLSSYTDGVSGTGADNLVALYVSSQDPDAYSVMVATWDGDYPIPAGLIVEGGTAQNVSPGDTVDINLITGALVRDTITVIPPDPGVNWDSVSVNLWNMGKSFSTTPDGEGVFSIYADTGTYSLNVMGGRYLALPSSRNIVVTGDTAGGMGFTINYANCHVVGHITGLPLPLDSGLMVFAQAGVMPDQYSTGAQVNAVTGEFEFYVCDGDWTFYPPSISNGHSPVSNFTAVTDDDTLLTFDFNYEPMYIVCDTVKLDPGDTPITMTNVSITLSGPGGYFTGQPDNNGVFSISVDTGLFSMTAFYNGYLASPAGYPLHITGDTCGGLGYTLNEIDIHVSGHLIGLALPLYSNSLHVNAGTDEYPVGYHTTSMTIDSITGDYHIYVCDGDWTFTAPEIPGYNSPDTWSISFAELDNADTYDFSYTSSGTDTKALVVPTDFSLSQNSPNPFNSSTRIEFTLPIKSRVELGIYNMLGQNVKTLIAGEYTAGFYNVVWDGTNYTGQPVASGIYLYRLAADDKLMVKKMVILK